MRLSDALLCFVGMSAMLDGELIREALQIAGVSIEKAAIWIGMDRRQLDRQLSGDGHFRLSNLAKLPLPVRQWYHLLALEHMNLPQEVRRSTPIVFALMAKRRMAKAAIQTRRELETRQSKVKVSA